MKRPKITEKEAGNGPILFKCRPTWASMINSWLTNVYRGPTSYPQRFKKASHGAVYKRLAKLKGKYHFYS